MKQNNYNIFNNNNQVKTKIKIKINLKKFKKNQYNLRRKISISQKIQTKLIKIRFKKIYLKLTKLEVFNRLKINKINNINQNMIIW